MKSIVGIVVSIALACSQVQATMVVHDPYMMAQEAVHEVVNYVQWLNQQVNSLNTYTNQVTQLARYGNPGSLISNIPGISAVRSLVATGQELMTDYATVKALTNPNQYQYALNNVLSSYQNPNWSGMTSGMGIRNAPFQQNYSFQTSQWQILQQAQQTLQQIEVKRQDLLARQGELAAAGQSAPTQSEVMKYHAALDAVNGALSSLEATEAQYRSKVDMLRQQLQIGQQIYQQANRDRNAGYYQQSVENNMLPFGGYHQINGGVGTGSIFGSVDNPALGGNGDPNNGGTWYNGAWGADIGNPNTIGIALPTTVLRTFFGNPDSANGAMVRVTDLRTGQASTFPVIDKGPGRADAAIDITPAAAQRIGMMAGDQMVYQIGSSSVN